MMNRYQALMFLVILSALGCKARNSRYRVKEQIKEVGKPMRVLYKENDSVYLATCKTETTPTGTVIDHVGEDVVADRAKCHHTAGGVTYLVVPYEKYYYPALQRILGISKDATFSQEEIRTEISRLERNVDFIEKLDIDANVKKADIQKIRDQILAVKAHETPPRAQVLKLLVSFLEFSSTQSHYYADSTALALLEPFNFIELKARQGENDYLPKTFLGPIPAAYDALSDNGSHVINGFSPFYSNVTGFQSLAGITFTTPDCTKYKEYSVLLYFVEYRPLRFIWPVDCEGAYRHFNLTDAYLQSWKVVGTLSVEKP